MILKLHHDIKKLYLYYTLSGKGMSRNSNAVIGKFKFCCYQFDRDDEQDQKKKTTKLNTLMLNRNQKSNINFSTAFRNKNIPIYKVLQDLYEGSTDVQQILPFLQRKRVNPELLANSLSDRDDLQYYIPQLITFMVIECNLQNSDLNQLVLKASMTDFYFAHSVYFYLQSLAKNKEDLQIQLVHNFIQDQFLPKMEMYNNHRLSGHQLTKSLIYLSKIPEYQSFQKGSINEDIPIDNSGYGLIKYPSPAPELPIPIVRVKVKTYFESGFQETPKFWIDLVNIGEKIALVSGQQRMEKLSELIKLQINSNLPSVVYIPFYSNKIRLYTILCVWQGRVFSTKQRAPFSLWIELYREQEQHADQKNIKFNEFQEQQDEQNPFEDKDKNLMKKIYEKLSKPFTVADGENTLKIKKYIKQKTAILEKKFRKRMKFRSFYQKDQSDDDEKDKDGNFSLSLVYETKSDGRSRKSSSVQEMMPNDTQSEDQESNYFPPESSEIIEDFRKKSVYRNLKSWRMMHLMVKLGDDLKQEQFAMQLINRFQYIFEKQNIQCLLKPYEVVSLGPNFGLIEMINDSTTLDGLFKKLSLKKMTLKDFFDSFYKKKKGEAKKNFMRSLAGYSLVTYFLQVKDRHNGNILLHRNGSIAHIDFGFFLSNAPGKGVELEKKVPFKLLSQYVEVLGSLNSEMFFEFRRLFYRGFKAIINNQEMILSIVKMMYKSQGQMMECFKKGERAIIDLENRFNPEGNIQDFCYNLINDSLDNWRAKWYDKFQYFFQKIYY